MSRFKPTKEFFESFLRGKIEKFVDKRTFAEKLKDILEEIEGVEPEKIEGTLLFDRIIFEINHKKNAIFMKLACDGKELFYIKQDLHESKIENIDSVALDLDCGLMQIFVS